MAKDKYEKMISNDEKPDVLKNGETMFVFCCDCSLRHIIRFDIKRGRTTADDTVTITWIRDNLGTELYRDHIKKKKKAKK